MPTWSSSSCAAVSKGRRLFRGALLLALPAIVSCAEEKPPRPPNVVLVCMDTVRADHLGAYGYDVRDATPYLDELAARSLVFTDASAAAGWTKPSVPSFLTGTPPCQHGVYEGSARFEMGAVTDVLPEGALTLAEVFAERGYRTAAFIKNAQLRPGNGFEQGFDLYRDEVGDARDIRWAGLDWLDEGDPEQPFFLYLHILDAHWPYAVPPEYAARFAPAAEIAPFQSDGFRTVRDAIHDGERAFSAEERATLEALYDGALRHIDDQLRLFARGLEQRGLGEDTVLCIVSDHGEEFGEHGRIGHGHGLWENLLHVPWILHVPGRKPERNDVPVSLLDVFPTLTALVGHSAEPHLLGVDRLADGSAERPILAEHKAPDRYQSSLRRGDAKVIRNAKPIPGEEPADVFPVRVGARWEAELVRDEGGGLVATQLKPREEDPGDPLELKGYVSGFTPGTFCIAGITVTRGEAMEVQLADDVADDEVRDGRAVKVRGAFIDGTFVADRLKLYPVGEKADFELRGPVEEVRLDGERRGIAIGGIRIELDARTAFKDVETGKQRTRMGRADVVRLLESDPPDPTAFVIDAVAFDLDEDPGEERPDAGGAAGLLPTLEKLSRRLAGARVFGDENRILLTPEALEKLRAIGYAR